MVTAGLASFVWGEDGRVGEREMGGVGEMGELTLHILG